MPTMYAVHEIYMKRKNTKASEGKNKNFAVLAIYTRYQVHLFVLIQKIFLGFNETSKRGVGLCTEGNS